jgi:outer membrane lipoprotein-sorting protein
LELILDKDYLISQIKNLEARIVNDKYLNFTLVKNNNKINIFFDNQTFNLIGWQTEDIYQNLVITFIYEVKLNQKIDQDIFKLPEMN